MFRFAIFLFLITAWATPVFSAVYSCRMPDGTIFLTDDRDRFPSDCEPLGVLELAPPPEPDPTTPPPQVPPDEPLPQEPVPDPEPPPQDPPAQEPWTTPEATEEPWDEPPAEPPPPGSAGFPPGLQPQQEAEEDIVEEPPEPGAPRLDPWIEEAQALSREYQEARQTPPATVEAELMTDERLQQIDARIDAFIEQLARSGLSPGEQDAVMRELPALE
jgi:hypothetical protein